MKQYKETSAQPWVTVAIPTFNRLNLLKRAIESVVAQNYQNLQIIVSDNAIIEFYYTGSSTQCSLTTIQYKWKELNKICVSTRYNSKLFNQIIFTYDVEAGKK